MLCADAQPLWEKPQSVVADIEEKREREMGVKEREIASQLPVDVTVDGHSLEDSPVHNQHYNARYPKAD